MIPIEVPMHSNSNRLSSYFSTKTKEKFSREFWTFLPAPS